MVQNGERVALVLSEEIAPLIVDWGDDGVGLRTLQAIAAESKRTHEFVQQILEDCGVRSVDGIMTRKALSAPPSTRFVIAPKDATAEVEMDDNAMRATVKVNPPNRGKTLSMDDLQAVIARKGITNKRFNVSNPHIP